MNKSEILQRIDRFVADTRTALFVRRADDLLMIRPDKSMKINRTASAILEGLYNRDGRNAAEVLSGLAGRLGVEEKRLLEDAHKLIQAVGAVLNEDFSERDCISFGSFDREMIRYPTLAEIALTYGCQNRCAFCYASSPHRSGEHRPMTTVQIKGVMEKILHQAHVPSLSFTGGEPTLHPGLPGLIRYGAGLGLRINLITNGIRASRWEYAKSLTDAGLASAQVSLESSDPGVHDGIVGRKGAHALTVAGVRNFQRLGIHVHTNTTLCAQNLDRADDHIRFVARVLRLKTLSMNMVIRTGTALDQTRVGVTYGEVAGRLPGLLETAAAEGVKLVWYSPIPYCIFNPVLFGLGAKSCACVDGILSVDPAGNVLPCSSFGDGIGSLVSQSFDEIYNSRQAMYWRKKKFTPPVCKSCPDADVCGGGCPLYWDAAGSFDEIPQQGAGDPSRRRRWEKKRKRSRAFGVQPPVQGV
jgi:radical SAM protein with 4Fe4S-binding SPASM domain